MGIYVNPGNRGFWQSIRSEIYVDKTGLIAKTNQYLNTEQQYICVSRPRRFGKSMALKMLAAYYSRGCDSGELFAGYKIAQDNTFKEYLNQYDVICLNASEGICGYFGAGGQGACCRAAGYFCRNGPSVYLPDRRVGLCNAGKTGV